VQHHQGWHPGESARAVLLLGGGQPQPGLQVDGRRPRQRGDLERPQHLVLVVEVGDGALQRRRVLGLQPDGVPGPEGEQEGVGVAAAAVHLDGEVEPPGAHPLQERLGGGRVLDAVADAGPGGQHLDGGEGRGPVGEQRGVPGRPQQGQLGPGIGGGQRLDGGQREDEVTESAAAQHGDPADVVEPAGRPPDPGPGVGGHETSGDQEPPTRRALASSGRADSRSGRAGTRTETVAAAPAVT
jgi:hypothetical protein